MQKFSPKDGEAIYPLLSNRRNIVVIADEAHRSQYGFKAKEVDIKDEAGNIKPAEKTNRVASSLARRMMPLSKSRWRSISRAISGINEFISRMDAAFCPIC